MNFVRLSILAGGLLFSGAAVAQVKVLDDDRATAFGQIQEAFEAFSINRMAKFEIKVTESADFWNKRYGWVEGSLLFDEFSTKPAIRFECNEYAGGQLQAKSLLRRIVADGSTFYVFDATTMTYSQTPYGGPRVKQELFKLIAEATKSSPSTLIGKMLWQVHGGRVPRFDPNGWLPGAKLVPAYKYDSTAFLQLGNPNVGEISVGFGLNMLNKILYVNRAPGNVTSAPSINWEMTVYPSVGGGAPFGATYRFTPPPNAKLVPFKG